MLFLGAVILLKNLHMKATKMLASLIRYKRVCECVCEYVSIWPHKKGP